METIGLFLMKSAAWLTGFALVYLLVLRNERYFRLNRFYLLTGILASLIFPLFAFHYAVILPSPLPIDSASVDDLIVGGVVANQPAVPFYYWIYLAGMVLFLSRLLFQTWKIVRKLKKAGHEQSGAIKLVRTAEFASSFSFFSYVFVNPSTSAHEMREIMNHEQEHIRQRHWLDLLLVEMICIVQWFNPFAWVYAHLVRQNHEYLADEQAMATTADPAFYQAALLNQLLGAPVFRLTNSFSYSLNKKRFKMMKKKIDSPFRKLKMLAVLPLAAMLFYAFAVPEYQYSTDNTIEAPQAKTLDVKGQVLKSDGSPLSGTSVILRGSTMGTITDQDGNFLMKGIPADGELVFSFVGFQSRVQKVTAKPMKVVLNGEKVALDKVTVTGYGATSTPPPPPPPPPPPVPEKVIDSANPPLIFLDGFLITKAQMDKINPETIESVNVLKDKADTEKYGEKAKNGVILIVSKESAKLKLFVVDGVPMEPGKFIITDWKNYVTVNMLNGESASKLYGEKGRNGAFILISKEKFMGSQLILLDGKAISKSEMDQLGKDKIASVDILTGKAAIDKYGEKAKNGVILISSKGHSTNTESNVNRDSGKKAEKQEVSTIGKDPANPPLYFVDNVLIDPKDIGQIKPEMIDHMDVLREKTATQYYGEKGKNGAVFIYTKEKVASQEGKRVPSSTKNEIKKDGSDVFVVVDEMPEFPGGEVALRKFMVESVKYPEEAIKGNIQGKVFVTFVVKSDGTVGNARIARGVDPLLDAEAIRVVNLLPTWKPGKIHGKEVNVSYTVPVQFALEGDKTGTKTVVEEVKTPKIREDAVFVVVEQMPEYPGGEVELRKFIASAVKYPIEAVKDKAQGRVFVSFVVNSLGKIEKAKIERSVHPALDAEAIRVVNQMPEWQPGKQHGQAVSVQYTIPIEFKLQ